MKISLLLTFIFIGVVNCHAQDIKSLEAMETSYQSCLDKGQNMIDCSRSYYKKIDSVLNLVYKNVQSRNSNNQKLLLKTEQIKWLSTRDRFFKNINKDPELIGLGSVDREMVIIDKKAEFVKDRIIFLLKK